MKLIRRLSNEKDKNGKWRQYGEFLCPDPCNKIVKKQLQHGKRDKSCGCKQHSEKVGNYKHGGRYTKLHTVWVDMKQRVLNIKNKSYKDYGGRGITICPEWVNDYAKFRDWALNNGYIEGLQINRINNNGNYEPSNCNFVTVEENLRNTRRNVVTMQIANEIRYFYKIDNYTQKELSERYNVSEQTIYRIINNKSWKENSKKLIDILA